MNLTFEITRKIKEFEARKCTSEKGFDTDGDDDLYHFHYDNHDDHVADDDDTDHWAPQYHPPWSHLGSSSCVISTQVMDK